VRTPTGIGVYTMALLRELAERGEFDLVAMAHREPLAAPELRRLGIAVEWHAAPLGVVWQQTRLPQRLARGDIDLFWSPLLTLPGRMPVPAVLTLHDLAALHVPETLPVKVRWSILPFLQRSIDLAARVVVGSQATADEVASAFPASRDKLRVIHHGVEPEFRPADSEQIAATRRRLGAPSGYFLAVGTLEPRKRLDLLLDAWELLRRDHLEHSLPLVVVGAEGWKNRALARRIARLAGDGVHRLGHLPRAELVEVVQAARALVYPSIYEGFGLPVAEALACGVPAIVADAASLPEVVADGGLIVEPDDPDALAGAMLAIQSEPGLAQRLSRAGRERAASYSWPDAAERLSAVLREALETSR